jgi:nucleotide-binding universal stress UspA family protein
VTAEVLGPSPSQSVVLAVAEPPPARALLDASKSADLVVVGRRGHGALTGLLLGSVCTELLHHAHCPVTIVPPRDRHRNAETVEEQG